MLWKSLPSIFKTSLIIYDSLDFSVTERYIYEDVVRTQNFFQDRACRRTPYVMSIRKRAGCYELALLWDAALYATRLTCISLFSAFKLTDPRLARMYDGTWLDVPFAQNFISLPLTHANIFSSFIPIGEKQEKCIPLSQGWVRATHFFLFPPFCIFMTYRYGGIWARFQIIYIC